MRCRVVIPVVLGLLVLAGTAFAKYPPDPQGDNPNCSGECSTKGTDLELITLSLANKRKTLRIKVVQYDKFQGTAQLYWPQVEHARCSGQIHAPQRGDRRLQRAARRARKPAEGVGARVAGQPERRRPRRGPRPWGHLDQGEVAKARAAAA